MLMLVLPLQLRILTSMVTSSSLGSLMGRAYISLYISVRLSKLENCCQQGSLQACISTGSHSKNPWLVLSSFRPTFHLSLDPDIHVSLPAGDSESVALEKELKQKQSVGISSIRTVDRGMTLSTLCMSTVNVHKFVCRLVL